MSINLIEYASLSREDNEYVLSKSKDGFANIIRYEDGERMKFICYNSSLDKWRIKFTIFHEIGHIELNHTEHSELADAEADFFAAYLMVPVPLIEYYNIQTFTEIEDRFEVSSDMAFNSYNRFSRWKWHKKKYGYEDYEKQIIKQLTLCGGTNHE